MMQNNIQKELEASSEFNIDLIEGTVLVKLSQRNVAIVEAMIRNDSAYIKSADVMKGVEISKKGNIKYSGSTAYWMNELKLYYANKTLKSFSEIIENAVHAVDRDNSTHLNADKVGREELTKRIIDCKENLEDYLRNPSDSNYELIRILSEKTSAETKARENVSFASKFCHYACFYLFEGTDYQDNYSIYDNVLMNVLPKYMEYYLPGEKLKPKDYIQYQRIVNTIREKGKVDNQIISRNGFDHLLWYYYKGRI